MVRIPEIILLEMLRQMRVLHALHLQFVVEELQKPERPRKATRPIFGILASGRVATGMVAPIPSRRE